MFNSDSVLNIQHPLSSSKKMCLCFDTVHIMKNIRNNFLNGKKFIFPEFIYNDGLHINVNCLAGYIRWKDLYDIYDLDKELEGHLRKAPKLLYQALHTANNKQFLWLYSLYTKQIMLLPKATCQAELMLPIFRRSSIFGGPFRTPSTYFRQIFLEMLLSLKTKKQNFTEF